MVSRVSTSNAPGAKALELRKGSNPSNRRSSLLKTIFRSPCVSSHCTGDRSTGKRSRDARRVSGELRRLWRTTGAVLSSGARNILPSSSQLVDRCSARMVLGTEQCCCRSRCVLPAALTPEPTNACRRAVYARSWRETRSSTDPGRGPMGIACAAPR